MGTRLYVAKKCDIQFGNTSGFSNEIHSFRNLMDLLGIESEGDIEIGEFFGIRKDNWKEGIQKLRNMKEKSSYKLRSILMNNECTKDELLSLMETL